MTLSEIAGDLNISYEDGLRLSELVGLREQTLYALDHLFMESLVLIILVLVVAALLAFGIAMFIWDAIEDGAIARNRDESLRYEGDENYDIVPRSTLLYRAGVESDKCAIPYRVSLTKTETWIKGTRKTVYTPKAGALPVVYACVFAVLSVSMVLAVLYGVEYSLNSDLTYIDGQIDTILGRYGWT